MTNLRGKIVRIFLLFSLCFGVLLGACTCRATIGFEPSGAYHVREVLIDEEGNEYSGRRYYEVYKKENLYDFSQFTFNREEKTVVVSKSYDDTQVIRGVYEYTAGEHKWSLLNEEYNEWIFSKLTVTLENGDVFEGTTHKGGLWNGQRHIQLSGNGISFQLGEGVDRQSYFAEFYQQTPQRMSQILFGTEILEDMNEYEDNRYPQAFREFYQSFVDRERLFIYPDLEYNYGSYNVKLFAKGERGLPIFRFTYDHSPAAFVYMTYLPEKLDELDADWVEKYKGGGQVWNETRTNVSFVYEYQDPNFAYCETLLIEIVRINGDEPIAEDFVSGLKFATIAGENRVYDCFTEDEIIALDKQYNNLKETDGRYNGEKIDGYEILDDIIYFQQTQVGNETVRIYRLLADNRMIAEEIVFGLGRFYHQGKFYTFNGYREISFLYLQFYAE